MPIWKNSSLVILEFHLVFFTYFLIFYCFLKIRIYEQLLGLFEHILENLKLNVSNRRNLK
jgi:hypothetical protein